MPDSLQSSTGTGFSCTTQEDPIVFIVEVKVENLGGEVSDDIGQVTRSEDTGLLILGDMNHRVYTVLILLISSDLLAGMLHLQQQLDQLHGHSCHLGDGHGHSACLEVLGKGHSSTCHAEREEEAGNCGTRLGTSYNSEALGSSGTFD